LLVIIIPGHINVRIIIPIYVSPDSTMPPFVRPPYSVVRDIREKEFGV
jgi:hypothetical protein